MMMNIIARKHCRPRFLFAGRDCRCHGLAAGRLLGALSLEDFGIDD